MKKVLQIPNYIYPHVGGIEAVARDIINSLDQEEYEQRVICFSGNEFSSEEPLDGALVTRVGEIAKISSQSIAPKYKKELKRVITEFDPDIVIFHYPNPFVAHYLRKYLKNKKFKFILWWHLDITKQKILGKFFIEQTRYLLSMADEVVATSPNYVVNSRFLSKCKKEVNVIPCAINEAFGKYTEHNVKTAKKIRTKTYKNKKIIFAYGRHVKYKGLQYLIDATKYLPGDYEVIIAGEGPLTKKLKKRAKGNRNIHFLGLIPDDSLKAHLLACDVFCFPSITKNEAFGIGLANAMSYGKPTVTFTIKGSGVNYVSLDRVTGTEVKEKNAKLYAEAIINLINDPELMQKYSENALKRVQELFTFESFQDSVNKLFNKIKED